MTRHPLALAALSLVACQSAPPPDAPMDPVFGASDGGELVELGEAPDCGSPVEGLARFEEVGVAAGLDVAPDDPADHEGLESFDFGGRLVATDLDADGDIDLLVGNVVAVPFVFDNVGGRFERVFAEDAELLLPPELLPVVALAAADLDGDRLPELIVTTPDSVAVLDNVGGIRFGAPEVVFSVDLGAGAMLSMTALGDADMDGVLDLLVATSGALLDADGDAPFGRGAPNYLLAGRGDGTFRSPLVLGDESAGTSSRLGAMIDLDVDGRPELLLAADSSEGPPTALWQRGYGLWQDVAELLELDRDLYAFGVDAADLNGDGRLDLCITSMTAPLCLVSDEWGTYVDATLSLGFVAESAKGSTGRSFRFEDLDNDGRAEAMQSGGPSSFASGEWENAPPSPDLLWEANGSGGFVDVTDEVGFGSDANHPGLATADFDGDGWQEVVLAGPGERPLLLGNRCGDSNWIDVALQGPPGNSEGWGATVLLRRLESVQARSILGPRGPAQGPPVAHFGLGEHADPVAIAVRWPDGLQTVLEEVPTGRRVVIAHPE